MERNYSKVDSEYDKDKYQKLLDVCIDNPQYDVADLHNILMFKEAQERSKRDLVRLLSPYIEAVTTVIELGCGIGQNLYFLREKYPDKQYVGGECSNNAIATASMLYKHIENLTIESFNFYDEVWEILRKQKIPAVVFTRHAIEQLPSARGAIETLVKYSHNISVIINIEPIYELINDSTNLGKARQDYTKENDYNTDLMTCIKECGGDIIAVNSNLHSVNKLNPSSMVVWRPPNNHRGIREG